MSLFEGRFGEDGHCFDLRFGFSLFEEIESAFVRGFLQGECLKSAVLDMPFYCEPLLGSELVSGSGSYEHFSDEIHHNYFGGSDSYFDSVSNSCFNDYFDHVSVYNRNIAFGGDRRYENWVMGCNGYENRKNDGQKNLLEDRSGGERRFGRTEGNLDLGRGLPDAALPVNEIPVISAGRSFCMILAVNGLSDMDLSVNGLFDMALPVNDRAGGIPYVNSSVKAEDRFSPSLILNVYGEVNLKAFPSLFAAERDSDDSLSRGEYNYSTNGGFSEMILDRIKADRLGDALRRQWGLFVGGLGGKAFALSEKCKNRVFAADMAEHCGKLRNGCGLGYDRELDYGLELDYDRNSGHGFGLRSWAMVRADELFSVGSFLLNGAAEMIGKKGFDLRNENHELGKHGLLFEQGREKSEIYSHPDFGKLFLKDRFDLTQETNRQLAVFEGAELSENLQRAELLWDKNVKAGFGKLGERLTGSAADVFLIGEEKENGVGRGRLFLQEYELCISPDEVRRIRRAAETECFGEPVKAEIKVDMSGMKNIINRETDIDSIVADLTAAVSEAAASAAEGVRGL